MEEEDKFNERNLQEVDDPDLDSKKVVELRVARLESLTFAWILPHIDSEESTSSTPKHGVPAVILSHAYYRGYSLSHQYYLNQEGNPVHDAEMTYAYSPFYVGRTLYDYDQDS
ncbi:hypothetical protein HAX54_037123 [Datura stramonium]|uniref:Uncharacterized protein n=1 Tax=Datura stramonium TaxID=4076 RepID=A0ABS8VKV8_DATST|nr:hypothetical protein [Datura stramonium]